MFRAYISPDKYVDFMSDIIQNRVSRTCFKMRRFMLTINSIYKISRISSKNVYNASLEKQRRVHTYNNQ